MIPVARVRAKNWKGGKKRGRSPQKEIEEGRETRKKPLSIGNNKL
jgi:hypothetical protein